MTLREDLQQSPAFSLYQNVFYQKSVKRDLEFAKKYIDLRRKENRLYPDDIVQQLPDVPADHPQKKEWQLRKKSLERLLKYLTRKTGTKTIMEIGCGNGWFSRHLAAVPAADVLGIDVNEKELLQAASLFSKEKNLTFAYADILQTSLLSRFDYIILASSIQYFSDVNLLLNKLSELLKEDGEIHILDSPVYKRSQVTRARERSAQYFNEQASDMHSFYHHHDWSSFKPFGVKLMYNPNSILERLRRMLLSDSPFPWVRIMR